jgi:hypothetical protein
VRKIHGEYPISSGRRVGQRNSGTISVYDFAYVGCNRSQYFPQIQTGRDAGRQIQEQLKPLVPPPKFRFCAHIQSAANTAEPAKEMMTDFALGSQALPVACCLSAAE